MTAPMLEIRDLCVEYSVAGWSMSGSSRRALAHVSLTVEEGASVGVVGESGSGKSTLARAIIGLVRPTGGEIPWDGRRVEAVDRNARSRFHRDVQMVFQDPHGSLDPRMTAGASVAEAIEALDGGVDPVTARSRVAQALESVGLDPDLAGRYPHQLSGGQCQRVAIARATVVRPRLLVCDEAVSALDVSVQAQIVNLLAELRRRHGLALLFISHNPAVVHHLCEQLVVLRGGQVVECASLESLRRSPAEPYTRALLEAIPVPRPPGLRSPGSD